MSTTLVEENKLLAEKLYYALDMAGNKQAKLDIIEFYIDIVEKGSSALARQEGEKAERERIDQWCNEWLRRNGEQVDIGTAIAFSAGLKQALKESHHVK